MKKTKVLMDIQISKVIIISFLLFSPIIELYSLNKISCRIEKDRVSVSDSIHFYVRNDYSDTVYIVRSILLYKDKKEFCYRSYLEDWELYVSPVKLSDKFKYSPFFVSIPPMSERKVSFYINQPYIAEMKKMEDGIDMYISKDIKRGDFLLELRFNLKSKKVNKISYTDTFILPLFRY